MTLALARRLRPEPLVFTLAVLLRLATPLLGAGLTGSYSYDPTVYYSAADALTFGRVPYRDYVLLHPPVEPLVLAPFAALGRLTTDDTGFVVANLAFMLLAGLNAVLVMRIVRRLGYGNGPVLLGGLFYAVWFGAVSAEHGIRLEPLGNFFLLLGLLAYVSARGRTDRRAAWLPPLLTGAAFGLAAGVKIWWSVPLFVMLGAHLLDGGPGGRWRRAGWYLAGAAGALVATCGPFFALAPGSMFRMVIADQLGRSERALPPERMEQFATLYPLRTYLPGPVMVLALVLLGAVLIAVLWRAWSRAGAKVLVVLAACQLLVLAGAPSWYAFYADYATPSLALVLAAAAVPATARRSGGVFGAVGENRRRLVAWVPLAAAVIITPAAVHASAPAAVQPFPRAALASAAAGTRCLMSDEPMPLIELNTLSRDFADGCRNWVDVTGRTYGVDKPAHPGIKRKHNPRWQHDLLGYLRSGSAVILARKGTGASRQTTRILHRGGVLAKAGGYAIYRTPHGTG